MRRCPKCDQEFEDAIRFCPSDGFNLSSLPDDIPTIVSQSPPPSGEADPMIGRILAGRFQLLEKLGQGGMGAVYKGQHIKMNRLTAIKILTSDLSHDPHFVTRFQREAEMASHIDHPNAVSIYDFGEAEGGLVYLAMEFIEGESLSKIIAHQGSLSLERVVRITKQSAEALNA